MKIIYYSPHPTHDIVSEVGYSTHQREVINALKNLGHTLIPVILGGTEKANLNPLTHENYSPHPLKKILKKFVPGVLWTSFNNYKLRKHDTKAGKLLEKAILEHQPDLIYERSEYLQDSGTLMAKKYKIKHFLEVNAPFVEEMKAFEGPSLFHPKAHKIEEFKLKHADKVISVSSSLANFLIKKYKCKADKIFIQPNCINPEKAIKKQSISAEKQLRTIGFVGSIFPYHGVDILIKGFAIALKSNADLKLMIVGDGKILPDMKALCADLNIVNHVDFMGKVPHQEVFGMIDKMDICVMADSNWYGSPVKLFEYGLMEKSIIAPNTLPVQDVMEHDKDGLLINNSPEEVANAILKLVENTAESQKMASHFHQKVLSEYTWKHAAENIIQLCE